MNNLFIKATEKACSFEEYIAAPYLRREFEVGFIPEIAEISICGLGFYMLYINGQEITKGHIAPYISNPDDYCYYDTYEITTLIKSGKNVIGIILGNGFYNQFSGSVWDFDKAVWKGAPRVALDLSVVGNGEEIRVTADEKFKTHPSPIIFDDLRMGEYYDARQEINGWNLPDYDDSGWKYALKAESPRGELKLCSAEPIKVMNEIKPVAVEKQNGGYLYDFGVNCAGVCKLKIKGERDQKITMWHGEILKDGKFSYDNIIFNRPATQFYKEYSQKDIYITKGEGEETYIPSFTYHGFRYVFVEGITDEQATEDLLTYLVMNSDIRHIGNFECSDDLANTLFAMVKRSDLSNYYYFPTDCPHREKNGWTGDVSASAEHMALLYDVEATWRDWLANIRKSQNDAGALPGIVPTSGWGFAWGNGPAWDSVLFNLPYELFKKRGNTDVIKENAHAMMRYLEYIINLRNEDGTIATGLGDWVPTGRKVSDYEAPLVVTTSIMIMDMARKAMEMYFAIGYSHQAEFAKGIYDDMRVTIRRELIDFDTMTVLGDCQTSQAMALYYGVFEGDEKQKAFSVLLDIIHKDSDRFNCGFLGMRVLFHVLAEFGEAELAYDMITKSGYPSYGHLVEMGETTLPEQFMPDGVNCGSHNHHFMGDIANWFMSKIAGLNVLDSENVEISPHFISLIDCASASYELPNGTVSVKWERKENRIDIGIVCPVNYTIKIHECYKDIDVHVNA